ncbi:hypothetical protein KPK_A0119 (plasmid) [Klebsiella variicola]|uniref:Uncharacterized protein n=1 Tax=Klebsiella variicola (strain 342) TaxID=507522 RepID=B5RK43_KLEV3|nr:hypothetical protein KPK_A0119 [Klebsiella variicola]
MPESLLDFWQQVSCISFLANSPYRGYGKNSGRRSISRHSSSLFQRHTARLYVSERPQSASLPSGQHLSAGISRISAWGESFQERLTRWRVRSRRHCTTGAPTRPIRASLSFCSRLTSTSIYAIWRDTFPEQMPMVSFTFTVV